MTASEALPAGTTGTGWVLIVLAAIGMVTSIAVALIANRRQRDTQRRIGEPNGHVSVAAMMEQMMATQAEHVAETRANFRSVHTRIDNGVAELARTNQRLDEVTGQLGAIDREGTAHERARRPHAG